MTEPELRAHCASYELHEPVTLDDVQAIFDDLKPRLAAGILLEVCIAGGSPIDRRKRVEVGLAPASGFYRVVCEIEISG